MQPDSHQAQQQQSSGAAVISHHTEMQWGFASAAQPACWWLWSADPPSVFATRG